MLKERETNINKDLFDEDDRKRKVDTNWKERDQSIAGLVYGETSLVRICDYSV